MKEVLGRTGWDRSWTVKRMRKLEEVGLVERVNHGTSRRTVLWKLSTPRTLNAGGLAGAGTGS